MEKEKEKDLKEYSEILDTLAKRGWEGIMSNKDHDHAVIALCKIMEYAEKKVILFDEDLSGDIINREDIISFRDSLIGLLSRKVKTYIILADKNEKDDNEEILNFFRYLKKEFPNELYIKLADSNFKSKMHEIFNTKISFVIADDNKFRIELFEDKSNKTRRASVSFNNTENVELINGRLKSIKLDKLEDYFQ